MPESPCAVAGATIWVWSNVIDDVVRAVCIISAKETRRIDASCWRRVTVYEAMVYQLPCAGVFGGINVRE
jgi:hypothetical protein